MKDLNRNIMITINREFKSIWFDAVAQILSADVSTNECKVKLTLPSGYHWFEDWNYQHTKLGFSRGEYFYLKAENTEVVSSAMHESSVYTDVRESHASGDTEQPQALVEGALEKITEDGNLCPKCGSSNTDEYHFNSLVCKDCTHVWEA